MCPCFTLRQDNGDDAQEHHQNKDFLHYRSSSYFESDSLPSPIICQELSATGTPPTVGADTNTNMAQGRKSSPFQDP
jgi:hypothetical protein